MNPSSHAAAPEPQFGLRKHVLGPFESLAQSISTMAPTASAAMTVPLVFSSAGNGTWLAYLLATAATLVVALCIARFAGESASPGSLYSYAVSSLPFSLGAVAAWSLLLAYTATGISVVGGFIHYANVVLSEFFGVKWPTVVVTIVGVVLSVWVAYRDVKVSARLMLYVELTSVFLITVVFVLLLWQRGFHLDSKQFSLEGVNFSGVRLGMVLAMFSFVGFESATTLGEEARDPLKTIPQAVIRSAWLSGLFFILASYTEVMAFPRSAGPLDQSDAPMSVLAGVAGISPVGKVIDVCAMVGMLACVLSCITAAARVLLLMAHRGLVPMQLTSVHQRNQTPHSAIFATGIATLLVSLALVLKNVSGETIYDWMGSLATYGFLTVYALVAIALPLYLKRQKRLNGATTALSGLAVVAMLVVLEGTLYPVPEAPKNWLPYVFVLYLVVAVGWNILRPKAGARA